MSKCPDCGRRVYDGEGCDCAKCQQCGTVGSSDDFGELDGDPICDSCREEKTGAALGVVGDGSLVFELGTIEVDEDGKESFTEDENEVMSIPAGAIGYREGTGWVYPVGWVKPKEDSV